MSHTKLKSLNHRQIADVLGLLDQHCLKNSEGSCRYVGDWSDVKIAETVSCLAGQVAYVRRKNFGNVAAGRKTSHDQVNTSDAAQLRALTEVVADLLERLGDRDRAAQVRELNGDEA